MKRLSLFLLPIFLIAIGCDRTTDPGSDEDFEPQRFQVDLIDENGEMIEQLSNQKAGELEIDQSIALFGNDFRPPGMAERMGIDPEHLKRDQIILHAEQEIDGELFYITMNFAFQNQRTWSRGSFYAIERPKEDIIERFRLSWQIRQGMFDPDRSKITGDDLFTKTPATHQRVIVNYAQFGFGGLRTEHVYQSMGGTIDLERVSEKNLTGHFSVNLLGLPTDVHRMDEFPDELDTVKLRIRGDFTANAGDFDDLRRLSADLENGVFIIL